VGHSTRAHWTLGLAFLLASGCESQPTAVEANSNTAPTCAELRAAFRASLDDFDSVRSGLEVSSSSSIYKTYDTSLRMRGSSSCVIRRSATRNELYCRWEAGENRSLMGAHYRAIRDQLKSCVKEGSVSQNDRGGSTRIEVEAEKGTVSFWVMAKYESPPYYVHLTVRR